MTSRTCPVPSPFALLVATLLATPAAGQANPEIDTERLLRDLSVMAHDSMAGRATGTRGAQQTRDFLASSLREAGVAPAAASMIQPIAGPGWTGANVVALVPGREDPEGPVIVLTAHYDHLGIRDGDVFNGADDNASGVAALLEIGRHLAAAPLDHTVVIAFMDAEETGMRGSGAFVANPPVEPSRIALNVNLDMVARTDGLLWAGGAHHTPALRPVLEELAAAAPLTLRLGHDRAGAPEGDDWTFASDHAAFHAAGIPFVYFGVEDHIDYHEATDDYERVDPAEFTAAVQTILMGLRALDAWMSPAR